MKCTVQPTYILVHIPLASSIQVQSRNINTHVILTLGG